MKETVKATYSIFCTAASPPLAAAISSSQGGIKLIITGSYSYNSGPLDIDISISTCSPAGTVTVMPLARFSPAAVIKRPFRFVSGSIFKK